MNSWKIHSPPDLNDRIHVFRNREEAGERLAEMLRGFRGSDAMILGIPAGGVPVAATMAAKLELPLVVIPVSKILFPWTTESGFGAVAFDGTEWINAHLVSSGNLDAQTVAKATAEARAKVKQRLEKFYGDNPLPDFKNRTVILVDDGIAAGSTMRAAIAAMKKAEVEKIIIAVPTGHETSLQNLVDEVDAIYCANRRSGYRFAVAEAYTDWYDVTEEEVLGVLRQLDK